LSLEINLSSLNGWKTKTQKEIIYCFTKFVHAFNRLGVPSTNTSIDLFERAFNRLYLCLLLSPVQPVAHQKDLLVDFDHALGPTGMGTSKCIEADQWD
jgi:hypothetical protein